jgi:S1-C subfamily serine protease
VSVDGKTIDDEFPLQYLLFTKLPNDTLAIGVVRDMQEVEVVLKLGEQ